MFQADFLHLLLLIPYLWLPVFSHTPPQPTPCFLAGWSFPCLWHMPVISQSSVSPGCSLYSSNTISAQPVLQVSISANGARHSESWGFLFLGALLCLSPLKPLPEGILSLFFVCFSVILTTHLFSVSLSANNFLAKLLSHVWHFPIYDPYYQWRNLFNIKIWLCHFPCLPPQKFFKWFPIDFKINAEYLLCPPHPWKTTEVVPFSGFTMIFLNSGHTYVENLPSRRSF